METPTGKCSENEMLWNKSVQKPMRQFIAKVTGDAAFQKLTTSQVFLKCDHSLHWLLL